MKNINLKLFVHVLVTFVWVSLFIPFGNLQAQVKKNQNLRSVMSTDYCDALTITATLGSDNIGCYINVTFNQPWTAGSNANVSDLPHGLLFETISPTEILSVSNISGAWFSSLPAATQTLFPPTSPNSLYWNKPPTSNPGNTIPSGQTLSFRVYINPNNASPISVNIKELTGWSWPNDLTKWNCTEPFTFKKNPKITYSINKDEICAGTATILNLTTSLSGGVPPTAVIQWYRAPSPCPLTVPPAGWTPVQTGGITYPTGILYGSMCYVAIITDGCYSYVSNVSTVIVCQPVSTIGNISANPISPSASLQLVNGQWHACGSWKGTLTLSSLGITCPSIITWTKQLNGGTPTGITCNPLPPPGQQCLNPETGLLVAPPPNPTSPCANIYTFTAKIENKCGFTTRTFQIVIDKATQPGNITANQNLIGSGIDNKHPNLCYDDYTILNLNVGCGDIKEWKYCEINPNGTYTPWQTLSGAGTSSTYWTNGLKVTTKYKVLVQNGACNSVFTPVITVLVKPVLTVNIAANNTSICPLPNPSISVNLTPGYPTAGLTYEWYRDGILIPTTTPPPLDVTLFGPGNYYVIVKDALCGSAQSNVISICGKPDVVISGACGICPGGSVLLEAIVESGCLCTYEWKKVGSTSIISTSSSINVNSPGSYTVTVKCGNCVVTRTHTIGPCPQL